MHSPAAALPSPLAPSALPGLHPQSYCRHADAVVIFAHPTNECVWPRSPAPRHLLPHAVPPSNLSRHKEHNTQDLTQK